MDIPYRLRIRTPQCPILSFELDVVSLNIDPHRLLSFHRPE